MMKVCKWEPYSTKTVTIIYIDTTSVISFSMYTKLVLIKLNASKTVVLKLFEIAYHLMFF